MRSRPDYSLQYFSKGHLNQRDSQLEAQQSEHFSKMYSGLIGTCILAMLASTDSADHRIFTLGYAAVVFGGIMLYNAGSLIKNQLERDKIKKRLEEIL